MPSARPEVASKANRIVAYAFDVVMVGIGYWFLAYAAQGLGSSVDEALTFALIFFCYHLAFLRWNDGISFGKSLRGICVISAAGAPLTVAQAVVRAAFATLPFALLAAQDLLAALVGHVPDAKYLATLPSLFLWLAELYSVESDTQTRSLTDRVANSIVVNIPPPQPHRAPAVPMYSATDKEFGPGPRPPPPRDGDGAA